MYFPKGAGLVIGALLPIVMATAPASAAIFDWTLTGAAASGLAASFSGSGTLTATEAANGTWALGSITGNLSGTFNGVALSGNITGLTSFLGSDQLIFLSSTTLVDDHGIAFALNLNNGLGVQDVDIFTAGPRCRVLRR